MSWKNATVIRLGIIVLLVVGATVLVPFSPVQSATYYVNDADTTGDRFTNSKGNDIWTDGEATNNPDSPFLTIERAFRAIAPGDTVAIDSGTFNDNLDVDTDDIKIVGASSDTTILQGRIRKNGGANLVVRSLKVENSTSEGIGLSGVGSPVLSNLVITGASDEGISLNNLTNAKISNVASTGAGNEGIALSGTDGSTITSSTTSKNGLAGISLSNSSNNKITNNVIRDNGQSLNRSGLIIQSSSDNNQIRNIVSDTNATHGILVSGSSGNRLRSNRLTDNGGDGVRITNTSSNPSLVYNLLRGNGGNGLRVNNTSGVELILNEIINNAQYQISLGNGVTFQKQSKNNVTPSSTNSDSRVLNESSNDITMERNWWNTTDTDVMDTSVLNPGGGDVDYIPFRLSEVDTAPGQDTVAPAVPPNITVDTSIPNEVRLKWNASNNNEESFPGLAQEINGFRIYRSQNFDRSDWTLVQINEQPKTDTDYVDKSVSTDTTYFYRITAVDSHTTMGSSFENESFFSKRLKANVPSIGPGIYVNDGSRSGDVFTTDVGNDSNVGIPQHPVRTISRALDRARDGDTIFIDTGDYADTLTIDTPNLTLIGAGQDNTRLTGSPPSINGSGFQLTGSGGGFQAQSLTIRDFNQDGITIDGAGNVRIENITLKDNLDNGIEFINGATNGYVAQTTFDENANEQIRFDGASGNDVKYSNIFTSATAPDSGVIDSNANNVTRNWWATPDSQAIAAQINGSSQYIPHRLGIVDTGVGADSIAPATPSNVRVDTTVPGQLTVKWNEVTTNENGTTNSDLDGYRVFRIKGVGDTPDWTQHLAQTLPASDTSFTDNSVVKTQPYSYRVTSFDNATPENSSYFSSVESGTWFNRIPDPDTAVVTTKVDSAVNITLSGTDVDGDAMTFSISGPPDSGSITSPADTQSMSGPSPNVTYTPDSGVTGVDQFFFKITDGSDTSAGSTVTVDIATVLNINVTNVRTTASETPAIANGQDTVAVDVTFRNSGTGNGIVLRDTDQLRIENSLGNDATDSFQVVMSGTDLLVPSDTTRSARWIIHTAQTPPPPLNSDDTRAELIGNFRTNLDPNLVTLEDAVSFEQQNLADTPQNRQSKAFNITSSPVEFNSSGDPDQIERFEQTITFEGGGLGGGNVFDLNPPAAADGDSIFVVTQRGNIEPGRNINTIDTPFLDPSLGINTESDFTSRINTADQNFKNSRSAGTVDFVDTGLLTVSIWLRTINGTYIGDDLNESVDVRVSNVTLPDGVNEPDRLEVVKLDFVNGQWTWRTVDDLSSPGDLSFNGSTGEITFTVSPSVGFSVFRIVTSGFSTSGDAGDAVVYPNPFIPEDGNPETGEYGSGSRQGIHFGAGQNRGFPSGTTVKIYTIRGQQVDKITTNNGGIIRWDAHTDNGDPAASGVYIYRIETPDGSDKVGKFAIVR